VRLVPPAFAAPDDTGSGINGTLVNSPRWVTGAPFIDTPNWPVLVGPANGAVNISTGPTLTANVSDPNGGTVTATFYGRKTPEDFTIVALPDAQHYTDGVVPSSTFSTNWEW